MYTETINRHIGPPALPDRIGRRSKQLLDNAISRARSPIRPLRQRICYLHIAKCGGTSLKHAIANCYKGWIPSRAETVIWMNDVAAAEATKLSDRSNWDIKRDLLAYYLSLARARCAMGHFVFSRAVFEEYRNEWHFITLMRHPVDRWFSEYFYNRVAPGPYSYDTPLDEFIKTRRAMTMASPFVSQMTEDKNHDRVYRDASIYETIERLKQFSLIGNMERFESFALEFQRKFKRRLNVPRRNVNPLKNRPLDSPITDEIRQRVTELCEPDLKVYFALFGPAKTDLQNK